jgi:protease I
VWRDEPVVRDANWLSSRGPQDMVPFTRAMIDHFAEQAPLTATSEDWSMSPAMSSPQRDAPPLLAVIGAATLPKISRLGRLLGAVAAFAAGGAAVLALRRAMS